MTILLVPNHLKTYVTILVESFTRLVCLDEGLQFLCYLCYSEGLPLWKVWIYLIREDLACKEMRKLNFLSVFNYMVPKGRKIILQGK